MPQTDHLPVISAGVDWLTATASTKNHRFLLSTYAQQLLDKEAAKANDRAPWAWLGYQGERCGQVTFGEREDTAIIRLSGDAASASTATALTIVDNVSRIDLAVTLQAPTDERNLARETFEVARTDVRVNKGLTKATYILATDNGATAYIGSRSSERYFRTYNKHVESRGEWPERTWRYEVEYKGRRAPIVAERLRQVGTDARPVIAGLVTAFADYGVQVPTAILTKAWRDTRPRVKTDETRRLLWLRECVAPALQSLLQTCDYPTVMAALGLDTGTGSARPSPSDLGNTE
jgi:DNA relaxase NicK